jgi:hypothetical protein
MTSFFHDLEDQLRTAARARAGVHTPEGHPPGRARVPSSHGRLARSLHALPVLAAVAVAIAVVVGALLVLVPGRGHTPRPTPPAGGGVGAILGGRLDAQTERELRYIAQANRPVQESAACRTRIPAHAQLIHARPSPAVLSILGVLRRPATPADHLASGQLDAGAPVYAGYIRRALRAAGTSYYIYVEHDNGAGYPSDRCLTLEVDAVNRALPRIPASLRAPTQTLEARLVAYERKLKALPGQDTVCFVAQARNGGDSSCGASVLQLENGVAPSGLLDTLSGVVPDGVASVTLHFAPRRGHPARSYTAPVSANVYAARVPGASGNTVVGDVSQPTVVWHAADGRTLKVIAPIRPGAARRACQAHPVQCVTVQGGSSERSSGSASATATTPSRSGPRPQTSGG